MLAVLPEYFYDVKYVGGVEYDVDACFIEKIKLVRCCAGLSQGAGGTHDSTRRQLYSILFFSAQASLFFFHPECSRFLLALPCASPTLCLPTAGGKKQSFGTHTLPCLRCISFF